MRRVHLLASLIGAVALLAAVPAGAKEGVRAKLAAPVRLDVAPGKIIRVTWRLEHANGRAFGASGIYLLVSRCGRSPLTIAATDRGRNGYTARLRVPVGGVRSIVVGLQGWRITGARSERADARFQFDPPLRHSCRR